MNASPESARSRTEGGRRATFPLFGQIDALFRVVVFWGSVLTMTVAMAHVVLLLYPFARLFDPRRDSLHRVAITWAKAIVAANTWWSFRIEGLDNLLRPETAVVYVANHQSQTDILVIYLLETPFRWLAKHSLFRIPLFGWAMRAIGYVPVNRGEKASHSTSLDESRAHLRNGLSMLFFPEGTRSFNGTLGPFKSGAFRLANEMGVPVVPITLVGTDTLLPKGSLYPRRASIRIIVHEPIASAGRTAAELQALARNAIASPLSPEKRRNG